MSGGHFDYLQDRMRTAASQIAELVTANGNVIDDNGAVMVHDPFSAETLEQFEIACVVLDMAALYLKEIDWLVCGDSSEETFLHASRVVTDLLKHTVGELK